MPINTLVLSGLDDVSQKFADFMRLIFLFLAMAVGMNGLGPQAFGSEMESDPANWLYPKSISAWDETVKDAQRTAARKLADDLKAAIAGGEKKFVIAAGDYRFGSGSSPNNLIIEASDLEIDAAGANFWFNGQLRADAIVFKNCHHVTFRGATVDYDPFPRYTQGEVLSIDPAGRSVVFRVDPGFALPETGWLSRAGNTKTAFFDPQGIMRPTRLDWASEYTPLEGRNCRVKLKDGRWLLIPGEVNPGDRLALPDRSMRMVFNVINSEKVTLEDVTIYAAPQMALTEEGGAGGHVYRRCKVVRRPATRRLIACNADIFHSTKVERGPLIEGCEFSYSCDDAVNIHSFASPVWEEISPTEIVLVSFFRADIEPVCELEFYGYDEMHPAGKARVLQVKNRPDLVHETRQLPALLRSQGKKAANFLGEPMPVQVTLDQPVRLAKFDLAFSNRRIAQGTVLRNNFIHDILCRGLLVKCQDGLIESNRIERTVLPAIMLATDRFFWEGPVPRNITVRDNHITDAAHSLRSRLSLDGWQAAIAVFNEGSKTQDTPTISDIRIENNSIERAPRAAIYLSNAQHSVISGNVVTNSGLPTPAFADGIAKLRGETSAIYIAGSSDIHLEKNQISANGDRKIISFGPSAVQCGPQQ